MIVVAWISVAWAQEPSRDDEIFGPSTPAPEPEPEPEPEPPSDDPLSEPFVSSEQDLARRLQALDERLTIGGRLWLQTAARIPDGVDGADDVLLDAPNLLDLFVDARPNDRVRAYANARLQHDWSIRTDDVDPLTGEPLAQDLVILDQLWTKFDVRKRLFVTAGRQRIRWGTGRLWNPTDFLNQQRLDPLAVVDLRTGVDLLKLHLPFEAAGVNLYAIANLGDAQALDEIGGAFRAEWAFSQSEISASAAFRKDQATRLGADLSSGLGPFDVSLEAAAFHGVAEPYWTGDFDVASLALPTAEDRSDEWLFQAVAGVELAVKVSAEDSVIFGVEGFYNGLGYPDAELYPWLALNGQLVPLYLGQAYGGAYVLLVGPGRWDDQTFVLNALANVSDGSGLARLTWRGTALTWLEPTAYVQGHFGEVGELRYGVELPAIPGILDDGLTIPPPLLDVGIGAIVRF